MDTDKIARIAAASDARHARGKIVRLAQALAARPTKENLDALIEEAGQVELTRVSAAPDPAPRDRAEKSGYTREAASADA